MKTKFLVGAATAAHQVEGNNLFSDVWAMEQMKCSSFSEPSLDAVDHYNRFEEDIALLAKAGLNAYRFSIEWARIEPEEGKFSEEEVRHYQTVLETCRNYGVEPIVTLHHFSSPKWLIEKGGWESENIVMYFARYAKYITQKLGRFMRYICTINEANMGIQIASLAQRMTGNLQIGLDLSVLRERARKTEKENIDVFGTNNPAVFLSARTQKGDELIIKAHRAAREEIKKVDPFLRVGLTLSLHDIQFVHGGEKLAEKEWQEEFTHYAATLKEDDFIGVQNYTRTVFSENGDVQPENDALLTQMGYEFYPEALANVVKRVYRELHIPVLITENGIATEKDEFRVSFIDKALQGVKECLNEKVPLLGYLHWSLLDNFEWQKGYGMKFGLIEVDRQTQMRLTKPSLNYLGDRAKEFYE